MENCQFSKIEESKNEVQNVKQGKNELESHYNIIYDEKEKQINVLQNQQQASESQLIELNNNFEVYKNKQDEILKQLNLNFKKEKSELNNELH